MYQAQRAPEGRLRSSWAPCCGHFVHRAQNRSPPESPRIAPESRHIPCHVPRTDNREARSSLQVTLASVRSLGLLLVAHLLACSSSSTDSSGSGGSGGSGGGASSSTHSCTPRRCADVPSACGPYDDGCNGSITCTTGCPPTDIGTYYVRPQIRRRRERRQRGEAVPRDLEGRERRRAGRRHRRRHGRRDRDVPRDDRARGLQAWHTSSSSESPPFAGAAFFPSVGSQASPRRPSSHRGAPFELLN